MSDIYDLGDESPDENEIVVEQEAKEVIVSNNPEEDVLDFSITRYMRYENGILIRLCNAGRNHCRNDNCPAYQEIPDEENPGKVIVKRYRFPDRNKTLVCPHCGTPRGRCRSVAMRNSSGEPGNWCRYHGGTAGRKIDPDSKERKRKILLEGLGPIESEWYKALDLEDINSLEEEVRLAKVKLAKLNLIGKQQEEQLESDINSIIDQVLEGLIEPARAKLLLMDAAIGIITPDRIIKNIEKLAKIVETKKKVDTGETVTVKFSENDESTLKELLGRNMRNTVKRVITDIGMAARTLGPDFEAQLKAKLPEGYLEFWPKQE